MSELQNPLFDEEKEFLERKKLEYERALRGDVDAHQGPVGEVGKVALVGAGLAGGIWLITKAFGGKKRKRKRTGTSTTADIELSREPTTTTSSASRHTSRPATAMRYKTR